MQAVRRSARAPCKRCAPDVRNESLPSSLPYGRIVRSEHPPPPDRERRLLPRARGTDVLPSLRPTVRSGTRPPPLCVRRPSDLTSPCRGAARSPADQGPREPPPRRTIHRSESSLRRRQGPPDRENGQEVRLQGCLRDVPHHGV